MNEVDTVNEPGPVATDVELTSVAEAAGPIESTPFWQRPYVERFLVPLVLPIAVIVGLVAYVLNISRIFLSGHGHIPVIVGSAITLMILLGATFLSASAPRLKQSAITLISAGFVLSIMSGGWLVLGHSQNKSQATSTLSSALKTTQTLSVTAAPGGNLAFAPSSVDAKTGLVKFTVLAAGISHTFNFHETTTLFRGLSLDSAGKTVSGVAFFPAAGDYHFFCAIPTHEANGMHGIVHVTGPTLTLQQALSASGNPPSAAGA
jgi:plastocyanin